MKRIMKKMLLVLIAVVTLHSIVPYAGSSSLHAAEAPVENWSSITVENDQLVYPSAPSGFTAANYRSNLASIHDTEFLFDNGIWYQYWTNTNAVRTSTNLINWTNVVGGNRGSNAWAPTAIKLTIGGEQKYVVYDSSSIFGTRNSQIRMWVSNSPTSGFVNNGNVIVSADGDGFNYNALDPKVLWDATGTKLYMVYGSWFGGIFIAELDPSTGKLFNQADPVVAADADKALPGHRIAYRAIYHGEMEGASIVYNEELQYYYLNVSYGDLDNTYNVRIGRSRSITGPYLDYNGNSLDNTTTEPNDSYDVGTKITSPYYYENDAGWYSLAHSSFIVSKGTGSGGSDEYFIASNSRASNVSATRLAIRKIFWTNDGWPLVSPQLYAGLGNNENVQDIPTALIPGPYQVVPMLREELEAEGTDNASSRRKAQSIFLNADRSISGEFTGVWAQVDGSTIKMSLDGAIYHAKIIVAWDWELWRPTLALTGISKAGPGEHDGVALWGKRLDPETMLNASTSALSLQATTRNDVFLPKAMYNQVPVRWTSSHPEVVGHDGRLGTRPNADTDVTMTAALSIWGLNASKQFTVTVKPDQVDESVAPLAHYPFTQGDNWLSEGGNNGAMTLSAGGSSASYTPDGIYKGGVSLTGTNQNGGYLALPPNLFRTEDFTFTGWVRRTGTNANETIFSFGDATNYFSLNAANLSLTARNGSHTNTLNPGRSLVAGQWTFVAVTLNGNQAKFYMTAEDNLGNLTFVKAGEMDGFYLDPIDIESSQATLGRNSNTGLHTFKGAMDEIRFFNRALSEEEVEAIMQDVTEETFVRINSDSYLTSIGQQKQLYANVYKFPVQQTTESITWSSSNESIAAVDPSTGRVIGISAGSALITATTKDDADSVLFTVVGDAVAPSAITITPATASMYDLSTLKLSAAVAPSNATLSDVVWTIDAGENIVAVDNVGNVSAIAQVVAPTSVTVRATVYETDVAAVRTITVNPSLVASHSFDETLVDSSYKQSPIVGAFGSQSYEDGIAGKALRQSPADQNISNGGGYTRLSNTVLPSSSQFTISTWMKADKLSAWTPLIYVSPVNGGEPFMTIQPFTAANGMPAFHICQGPHFFAEGSEALETGTWYHITATYDNGTASLYINGELAAFKRGMPASPFSRSASEIWIGANRWDTVFDGLMDEFKIYGAALSAEKVNELYQSYFTTESIEVTTALGSAPKLPLEVPVTYMDGSTGTAGVKWDTIDVSSYAQVGKFSVKGRVGGTSTMIEAAVTVVNLAVTKLTGPDSVRSGEDFTVTYGLDQVSGIVAQDLTVRYDKTRFEFAGVRTAGAGTVVENVYGDSASEEDTEGTEIETDAVETLILTEEEISDSGIAAAAVTDNVYSDSPFGLVHIKLQHAMPWSSSSENDIVAYLDFKAISRGVGEISMESASLTNHLGNEIPAEASAATIVVDADKLLLEDSIEEAQAIYDAAQEGVAPGQYPSGSKTRILMTAIVEAASLLDQAATPEETANAIVRLNQAITDFERLLITSTTGDFNDITGYDVGDLQILASHYGKNASHPDWSAAKFADLNGDHLIGLYELGFISGRIVASTRASSANASNESEYQLSTSTTSALIGTPFSVSVLGQHEAEVSAFEVRLTVDREKLELMNSIIPIEDGFAVMSETAAGEIILAFAKFGNATVTSDDSTLGTITLKGKAAGSANVRLASVNLLNANLEETRQTLDRSVAVNIFSSNGDGWSDPGPIVHEEKPQDSNGLNLSVDESGMTTATVTESGFQQAVSEAKNGRIVIPLQTENVGKGIKLQLPAQQVRELISESKLSSIVVEINDVTVTFLSDLFAGKLDENSSFIQLSIQPVIRSGLPASVAQSIGNRPAFEFTLSIDKEELTDFKGRNSLTVAMGYNLITGEKPGQIIVYYIDDNGRTEIVKNGRYNEATKKIEFAPKHFSIYAAAYVPISFNDLSNADWARKGIEALAARGALTGVGNDLFDPNATVTRAAFITMLMRTFDLIDESAKTELSDVESGSWYYSAVASAAKAGITIGRPDGTFGVNDPITREELAVLTHRVAHYIQVELGDQDGKAGDFIDHSDIADYASDAVTSMQRAGIINGIGNGIFAPKEQSTRAQAATIIYKLYLIS